MKRAIKNLLFRVAAFVDKNDSPKNLFYHDIGRKYTEMGTDAGLFAAHMQYARECDTVCFDDGFRGIWDARELLPSIKPDVKVFLAVDLVGMHGYLDWNEILCLHKNYHVDFQCHTWTHQTLAGPYNDEVPRPANGRTGAWFAHEIVESKAKLETCLGKCVTELCFPLGYFSRSVVKMCKSAGYKKVYASYPGGKTQDFIQPRCLAQDLSTSGFRAVLNGGMDVFRRRYRRMHIFQSDFHVN